MKRLLFVAEKPSISKSIAQILGGRPQQIGNPPRTPVTWRFEYLYGGQQCEIVCTSVAGHIMEIDFPDRYKRWESCSPIDLFQAPIVKSVKQSLGTFASNIRHHGRTADIVVIWTDCDREGENIGAEIAEIAREVNHRVQVLRARFSVISPPELRRAMNQLDQLNLLTSAAVDARQELDLRIGAAFTRFMTKRLRVFSDLKDQVLSYGPCQFPTLGFVVDRYRLKANFETELFWRIDVAVKKEETLVKFNWQRTHLFDHMMCNVLFERCQQARFAVVVKVDMKPKDKWKPLPLTTIEMTKLGSRLLHISSDRIMKIAEDLYNRGLLSYPRTETDQFEPTFELFPLIQKQQTDVRWGAFAQGYVILDRDLSRPLARYHGLISPPRRGKNNDKAHPPIHPTALAPDLSGDEKKIFELVTRRFLACCSQNAKGSETVVELQIAEESFTAKGLMILERNYLDVYPYDRWSDQDIPTFRVGERLIPDVLQVAESATQPPPLLSEADLITMMDKSGIGTDATIAQHIKTIQDRKYAMKDAGGRFSPTTLGFALIEGYDNMGFGYDISLSKPYLRSQTEADMKRIMDGVKTKDDVVRDALRLYMDVFNKVTTQSMRLQESVARHFGHGADIAEIPVEHNVAVKKCRCGQIMTLRSHPNGRFVALLQFRFVPGKVPPYIPLSYVGCLGCDLDLVELLQTKEFSQRRVERHPVPGVPQADRLQGSTRDHRASRGRSHADGRTHGASPYVNDQNTKFCECGQSAALRTVRKEGPNMGRQFHCCLKEQSDPSRCNFFEFEDDPNSRTTNATRVRHGGSLLTSTRPPGQDDDGHDQNDSSRCNFFEFDDEPNSRPQLHGNPSAGRPGGASSGARYAPPQNDDQENAPRCRCGLLASKKKAPTKIANFIPALAPAASAASSSGPTEIRENAVALVLVAEGRETRDSTPAAERDSTEVAGGAPREGVEVDGHGGGVGGVGAGVVDGVRIGRTVAENGET
ncbi:DNA topoisomerase 3-alpha [Gonapodya sp. JEL0774]|nr:DNA topoisomerase 3-alpha [Gonapodya sp. JEL0774]